MAKRPWVQILAGLYALERLDRICPDHWHTVVDAISAYLHPGPNQTARSLVNIVPVKELQVHLTAQRILTEHLHAVREGRPVTPPDPLCLQGRWLR